jgi:hypothetical protein
MYTECGFLMMEVKLCNQMKSNSGTPFCLHGFTAIFLSKYFFPFENIAVDINVGNFKDNAL